MLDGKQTKVFLQFAYCCFSLWCFDIVFMLAKVWSGLSLFFFSHSLSVLVQGDLSHLHVGPKGLESLCVSGDSYCLEQDSFAED